jgi:hypothetical protein
LFGKLVQVVAAYHTAVVNFKSVGFPEKGFITYLKACELRFSALLHTV